MKFNEAMQGEGRFGSPRVSAEKVAVVSKGPGTGLQATESAHEVIDQLCGCERHRERGTDHWCARVLEVVNRERLSTQPLETEEKRQEYQRLKQLLVQNVRPIVDAVDIVLDQTQGRGTASYLRL